MQPVISFAGAKYKNQCPVEDKIPIYLIVAGVVGVFRNLISLGQRVKQRDNEDEEGQSRKRPLESFLDCFLFVWFICGNVWIYQNYHPNYTDTDNPNYCHKTLYLFAFWVTTSMYIVVGVLCCCVCCVGICAAAFGNDWMVLFGLKLDIGRNLTTIESECFIHLKPMSCVLF